jgi:hypothetical protein
MLAATKVTGIFKNAIALQHSFTNVPDIHVYEVLMPSFQSIFGNEGLYFSYSQHFSLFLTDLEKLAFFPLNTM